MKISTVFLQLTPKIDCLKEWLKLNGYPLLVREFENFEIYRFKNAVALSSISFAISY